MSNPFETRLQSAFEPLLTRAKRRVARLAELRAQPVSEARDKSIAAETREIKLVKEAAEAVEGVVKDAVQFADVWHRRALNSTAEAVQNYDNATHYEAVFHRAVNFFAPMPSERTKALETRIVHCLAIQANPQLAKQFFPTKP